MANIPDWVKAEKEKASATYGKGLSVKEINGKYYLYKRSSKRIPGVKNPKVTETYVGVITPNGLVLKERGLSKANVDVYEYGFSRVLLAICPANWKKALKADWMPVLYTIIQKESPNSYLLRDYEMPDLSNRNINLQTRNLWEALPKDTRAELEPLRRVYQIAYPDRTVMANISEEQIRIAHKHGVDLEGDYT